MNPVTKFEAFDGKLFSSEAECAAYEEANAGAKELESDVRAYRDALTAAGYNDRASGLITGHVRKYLTWVETGELAPAPAKSAAAG